MRESEGERERERERGRKREREREEEREREREGGRESGYESDSSPNPDFREVRAELSRNFRKKFRYNPGFPASATYDGSHNVEAGLR